jgi:hypothetical protein
MAVPRVIGIALKRPLRVEILHACEKAMNNEEVTLVTDPYFPPADQNTTSPGLGTRGSVGTTCISGTVLRLGNSARKRTACAMSSG